MAQVLSGMRIAALVDNGFEQVELDEPRKALEAAGGIVDVVAPRGETVRGWQQTAWGDDVKVDRTLADARAADYDALLLPGGVMSPDRLRMNPQAIEFVKAFTDAGRPVAAICHGPWTLIEADAVRGRRLTSWPSLQTDLRNAGALWTDSEVVEDRGLVTSRKPDDISAFNGKMIELFAGARPARAVSPAAPAVRR